MAAVFSRSLFWKQFIPVCTLLILCGVTAAFFIPGVIRRNVEQNAALVEEATAATESLRQKAWQLTQAVGIFKLGAGKVRPEASVAVIRPVSDMSRPSLVAGKLRAIARNA